MPESDVVASGLVKDRDSEANCDYLELKDGTGIRISPKTHRVNWLLHPPFTPTVGGVWVGKVAGDGTSWIDLRTTLARGVTDSTGQYWYAAGDNDFFAFQGYPSVDPTSVDAIQEMTATASAECLLYNSDVPAELASGPDGATTPATPTARSTYYPTQDATGCAAEPYLTLRAPDADVTNGHDTLHVHLNADWSVTIGPKRFAAEQFGHAVTYRFVTLYFYEGVTGISSDGIAVYVNCAG